MLVAPGFVAGVSVGLADCSGGQSKTQGGEGQAEEERFGPQPGVRGDVAGRQRRDRDGTVAGGFVEPHRQAALRGSGEVDLHDHRGGPGHALAHAEQHVGDQDPTPRGRGHQQQRDGHGDQPTGDENRFAPEAVAQRARDEVSDGLRGTERDDERQRRGVRGEVEDVLGQ